MPALHRVAYFLGGAFLINAVPHLVSGVTGRPFQTPFAKPPGEGLSSSTVNVVWAFINLLVSYLLLCRIGEFDVANTADVVAMGVGAVLLALFSARHFGRFHGGNLASRNGTR